LSLSKNHPVYFSKHNVLETGFCLCLQVKSDQLGPIDRIQSPKCCVLKNKEDGFQIKTRGWIMSKNIIFVLMYHRHKLLDLIRIFFLVIVNILQNLSSSSLLLEYQHFIFGRTYYLVQILSTLNCSDITSKLNTLSMSVIVNL
jgi:hypothetical protein